MKKLIYNIVLLFLSVILCVTVAYTWFSNNATATAEQVIVRSETDGCTTELYHYSAGAYTIVTASTLDLGEMNLNQVEYFKLVITSQTIRDSYFTFSYGTYDSEPSDDLLISGDTIYTVDLAGNNLNLYTLDTNDQVVVNSNVLLDYSSGNLELGYYRMEDAIRTYVNTATSDLDTPSIDGITSTSLDEDILINGPIGAIGSANEIVTVYFGIEFNELYTLVSGDSNCYSYQKFIIDYFKIKLSN